MDGPRGLQFFETPPKGAELSSLIVTPLRMSARIGGASLVADQRVKRDNAELVRMELKLACMSPDGRPARLPAAVKTRLEEFRGNVHSKKQ